MLYRTASDYRLIPPSVVHKDGSLDFHAPLHAYVDGTLATVCGIPLGTAAVMHHRPWAERPAILVSCPTCTEVAEP
jgi:hypothetical protein